MNKWYFQLESKIKIIEWLYQNELFAQKPNSKNAFEKNDFSQTELLKIDFIVNNYSKLRLIISKFLAKKWDFERIAPLERAILLYGALELRVLERALVINEMINLTKIWIPGNNYKYINSVLDNVGKYYDQTKN